jgi:hypothetical protein
MILKMLCDYGCGKEAKYYFKSVKKWCCSRHHNKCDGVRKDLKKKKKYIPVNIQTDKLCDYGCGEIAKYKFRNEKVCCSFSKNKCKKQMEINSKTTIGTKRPPRTEEFKKAISIRRKNKKHDPKTIEKIKIGNIKTLNTKEVKQKIMESWTKERREKRRQYMLNGGAAHCNSFIQNPSTTQVELFNRIKKIYPNAILNYPCYPLNFSLDVAIPELMICFESDGSYWHQNKDKDLKRQKQIEDLGWRMIRYYPIDSLKQVPQIKQIIKDIENIIGV